MEDLGGDGKIRENNTKMDRKEIGFEVIGRIKLLRIGTSSGIWLTPRKPRVS
jgi:hypothetical protein